MRTSWQQTAAPTLEPIDIAGALQHLRLGQTPPDVAFVQRAIKGARARAETYLRRGLLTQTWQYAQDGWSDVIALPMAAPLASVTSVQYYANDGTLTTLATTFYGVDTLSEPGRVFLKPTQIWPTLQDNRPMGVVITYVVGWTAAASIPADIVDGIYLLLGNRYEHREDTVIGTISGEIPESAEALLAPHRVFWSEPCESVYA